MVRPQRAARSDRFRSVIAAAIEPLEHRVLLSSYTVSNLNDSGPGSLRDAIQQANAHAGPDAITFASGLHGAITLTTGDVTINTDDLTITGPGASALAVNGGLVVDDLGSLHGVHVQISGLTMGGVTGDIPDTQITLADCTVGTVDAWGATVIRRCTVSGILAHGSAGFDVSDSTIRSADFPTGATASASFTDCTISGSSGDGIYAYDEGTTITLTRCTVSGNAGSGIRTEDSFIKVIDSTISGNGAAGIDGNDQPSLTVSGSTIANNKGTGITYNGGVAGGLTLVNSTVANNMGGGINAGGFLTVTNSTIVGNVATTVGGVAVVGATTRINNSIVAGNRNASGASDISVPGQVAFSGSNNLIGTGGSGGLVNGQNGNIVGVDDPMLAPLGDYGGPTQTMPPLGASPAIDHGSNALAVGPDGKPLTTDQRGYNRIFNDTVDIGADEFGFAPASQVVTNLNDAGPGSLRQAVLDANIHKGPDTITFAPGLSGTITLTTGDVTTTDDSTIITGPGASVIAVSGRLVVSAFGGAMYPPALDISGLTIDRVSGDNFNTQLTLTDCTVGSVDTLGSAAIRRCTLSGLVERDFGDFDVSDSTIRGAVEFPVGATGSGSFTNCTITGSAGDGIHTYDESTTITLTRCTVSGNAGAGIHTEDGFVQLIDTTISGNGGAGIDGNDQPSLTVSGSTIANNKGAGITYNGGVAGGLTLVNSTVANNMGGGINAGGFLTVTNSTIAGNVGTTVGGIAFGGTFGIGSPLRINNTIIAGNRNANGALDVGTPVAVALTGSNNLIGTGGSGGLVNGQNGNIVGVADPKLAPLGNYGGPTQTMPPLAGSPAIDAGNNALAVDENGKPLIGDQRGYYRIVNGKVDIGSVEFNSTPLVPGDANGDGKVDFSDLLILARNYGTQNGASWSGGDFTGDGAVNFDDLLILARNYGKTRLSR